MRRLLVGTAAGLCLVPLLGLGLLHGGERTGAQARGGKSRPPSVLRPADDGDKTSCGSHGTAVAFVDTPREAAQKAKKEQKLVFVLHVSGNFEDPRFT